MRFGKISIDALESDLWMELSLGAKLSFCLLSAYQDEFGIVENPGFVLRDCEGYLTELKESGFICFVGPRFVYLANYSVKEVK